MASFTSFLNLLKKNPATDGKDTFNIETMLNENWDKIDLKVKENSSAIGQISDKSLQGKNYLAPNLYKPSEVASLKTGGVFGIMGDGTTVDGMAYNNGYGYNILVFTHSVDLVNNPAVTQILTCTYNHQYDKRMRHRTYYAASGGWSAWQEVSTISDTTLSTVAPSSFIGENIQHQVY